MSGSCKQLMCLRHKNCVQNYHPLLHRKIGETDGTSMGCNSFSSNKEEKYIYNNEREVTFNNGILTLVCLLSGNFHLWFIEERSNKK